MTKPTAEAIGQLRMNRRAWLGVAGSLSAGYGGYRLLTKPSGFVRHEYVDVEGWVYPYHVFIPHTYNSWKSWPLIVYLHGSGASGYDDDKPIKDALGAVVRNNEANFPFLIMFPQSLERTWDADSADGRRVLANLDEVCRTYSVDHSRVYLTGYSMGGRGTWSISALHPDRWAAIAPVCGYGNPVWGARLAKVPCWCFHGAADTVIQAKQSRVMVEAAKAAGGIVKYTEYANVGHEAWHKAYASPDLYEWLLSYNKVLN